MRVLEIQFSLWDRTYYFDPNGLNAKRGDLVIVETELGIEVGKVVAIKEISEEEKNKLGEIKPIVRLPNAEDKKIIAEHEAQKNEAIDFCRKVVRRQGLEMKIVDVHFSFDNSRATFAFIADSRIDFREAVKELTRHFHCNIRLQQLGVRDEARLTGDVGSCGLGLCCQKHLTELTSVTSELTETQQIAHRGSERLAGMCGRLRCCLAYEQKLYEDLAKKLPPVGTAIKTDKGKGTVIGWHILKGSVNVRLDEDTVIEHQVVDISKI